MISEQLITDAHILPLRIWPDPVLSMPCESIAEDVETVHEMAHAMIATMRHYNGVGLAAPQVGILYNMFVAEAVPGHPMVFVNPSSLTLDDTELFEWEEGCLSIPGVFQMNKRPKSCEVSFTDIDGEPQTHKATGLESFIIQHEIDHLQGRLFIDDWSRLKLERARKKVDKHKYR